ncbi:MAG: hypothetical protein WBD47_17270 [Phormidesmis sp.]
MTNSSQGLRLLDRFRQWFSRTPDRALDQAYEAALKIRQIEDNLFSGNPISESYGSYSRSSYRLLQRDLKKHLSVIKRRMAEFRASSSVYPISSAGQPNSPLSGDVPLDQINGPAVFFSKLQLVDTILERYSQPSVLSPANLALPNAAQGRSLPSLSSEDLSVLPGDRLSSSSAEDNSANEALSSRSGVLPRSICGR